MAAAAVMPGVLHLMDQHEQLLLELEHTAQVTVIPPLPPPRAGVYPFSHMPLQPNHDLRIRLTDDRPKYQFALCNELSKTSALLLSLRGC